MYVYRQSNFFKNVFSVIIGDLNEIYQRMVELEINIKMLVPCQSAFLLFFNLKLQGQSHGCDHRAR